MKKFSNSLRSAWFVATLALACCACSEPWASGYDAATAPPTPEANGEFTIPSGRDGVRPIDVRVTAKGDGRAPLVGETVLVHYVGTFVDGEEFDSSRRRGSPFAFELGDGDIIQGWHLVVERMHVGDRWSVTIPSPLAYGTRGSFGAIPANTDLVFDIELLAVR